MAAPYHPFAPSSDDSRLGGMLPSDSDDSGPRHHFFPTASGLVDGVAPRPGCSEGSGPKSCHCSNIWHLPSLSDEVRLLGAWVSSRGDDCQDQHRHGYSMGTVRLSGSPRLKVLEGKAALQDLNPSTQSFLPDNRTNMALLCWTSYRTLMVDARQNQNLLPSVHFTCVTVLVTITV